MPWTPFHLGFALMLGLLLFYYLEEYLGLHPFLSMNITAKDSGIVYSR